jgi:SAM-dependent methyltransferase
LLEILGKVTKKKRLPITPQLFDVTQPLPFPDGCFDAAYSHMLLNMRFSLEDLHFIFSEINRVLKPKAFNFFSVRNQNDKSYGSGVEVDRGIYEINGFQIRFFTKKEIDDLATAEGFKILWMKEEYEEPVTLFLVSSKKADIVICECDLV